MAKPNVQPAQRRNVAAERILVKKHLLTDHLSA